MGPKFPRSNELLSLHLSPDVANCRMAGDILVQSASGSLQCSSDGGRMLKSWSVMRFKGTYL